MYELFIEGFKVDIDQKLSIQLTYAIDDVANFGSRETSFSKDIVLPGTGRNNQIFGFIYDLGSNNPAVSSGANIGAFFNVARVSNAELRLNGLLVMKGVFRITNVVKDKDIVEYEGALFGELAGFVSKIANQKLEDLNFSEYDLDYTITNIVDSWNPSKTWDLNTGGGDFVLFTASTKKIKAYSQSIVGLNPGDVFDLTGTNNNDGTYTVVSISITGFFIKTTTITVAESLVDEYTTASGITIETALAYKGVFFPLIDYGNYRDVPTDSYGLGTFRPALYVKEYIDKMFLAAGYSYQSDFFNSEKFRSLIIPHNQKELVYLDTSQLSTSYFDDNFTIEWPNDRPIKFSVFTGNNFTNSGNPNYIFTYTNANSIYTTINFTINNGLIFGRSRILKNGEVIGEVEMSSNLGFDFGNPTTVGITVQTELQQNDTIQVVVRLQDWLGLGIPTSGQTTIDATLNIVTVNAEPAPIFLGDEISINEQIPRGIFQKDFFSSIIKMFNLYVYEDKDNERLLNIVPYKDYMTTTAIDWTFKVARDKPWQIKPMGRLNAQVYEFKYKTDSDFYNDSYNKKFNQPYGTIQQKTGFEYAKDKETTEIIFAPSPLIQYASSDKFVVPIYKKSNNNAAEDRTDSIIRILFSKRLSADSWNIIDGENTYAQTYYGYAGHLDDPTDPVWDLNFGAPQEVYGNFGSLYPSDNLFNTYWDEYIAEIADKDSKILSCYARLTPLDIAQLDFSKPIMIDGVLFRLNKVEDFDYTNNELVKIELLKIINNG